MTFTESEKKAWKKAKSLGRIKFGLMYGIILGVVNYFIINLEDLPDTSFTEAFFSWKKLLLLFFLMVFNSIVFGGLQWWLMEKSIERGANKNV